MNTFCEGQRAWQLKHFYNNRKNGDISRIVNIVVVVVIIMMMMVYLPQGYGLVNIQADRILEATKPDITIVEKNKQENSSSKM